MVLRILMIVALALGLSSPAFANDRQVALYAPQALVDSGLLRHILPRFSLKTQVRVTLVPDRGAAQMVLDDSGPALFDGLGRSWHLEVLAPDHRGTQRLAEWLQSDVGTNTITGFAPEGVALFAPPTAQAVVVEAPEVSGDAALGHKVSRTHCTRCHAVDDATRGWGIGSTPSFAVLRSFPDWEERFWAFYVLAPHPAFTQIEDVTPPFPIDRPSPIAPVEMTFEDVEAVVAYVASMAPADLGKPIEHQ